MELTVYAVVFSNYEPAEVAAIYDNEAAAEQHIEAMDNADPAYSGGWRVVPWSVRSKFEGLP